MDSTGAHSLRKVDAARRFLAGNAATYDMVVHLWTLGLGLLWKRKIIAEIPPSPTKPPLRPFYHPCADGGSRRTRVIGLSMYEDGRSIQRMRQSGGVGYVSKFPAANSLLSAIRRNCTRRLGAAGFSPCFPGLFGNAGFVTIAWLQLPPECEVLSQ